jgi:hypothetical protein
MPSGFGRRHVTALTSSYTRSISPPARSGQRKIFAHVNRNILAAIVAIVIVAAGTAVYFLGRSEPPPPPPGVPEALATERAARVSNLRYD